MRDCRNIPLAPVKGGIYKHKNPGQNGEGVVLNRVSTQNLNLRSIKSYITNLNLDDYPPANSQRPLWQADNKKTNLLTLENILYTKSKYGFRISPSVTLITRG